jgi:hypothetical protein
MEEFKGLECACTVIPSGRFGSFNKHVCGRPAKGRLENGTLACGLHLNAEKREKAAEEEYRKRREAAEIFHEEIKSCPIKILWYDSEKRTVKVDFDELMAMVKKGEPNGAE